MVNNSITNRQIRGELVNALQSHGYTRGGQNADFLVAFYVGERAKFDTTYYAPDRYRYAYRGYRDSYAWPYYGYAPAYAEVRASEKGSVIVDLIDPRTNELLWRGQGTSTVSSNPNDFAGDLGKAIDKIVSKIPQNPASD